MPTIPSAPSSTTLDDQREEHRDTEAPDPRIEHGYGELEKSKADPLLVDWAPNDPHNPFNWSKTRKWAITIVTCIFTAFVAMAAAAYTSGLPGMEPYMGISHEVGLLGITLYTTGFALGPMLLAPISEVYGRSPMYYTTYFVFALFMLPMALAQNITTVFISRFIAGVAGSTGSTMVGGTLADIWVSSQRGNPMSLFATVAVIGIGLGPAFAGYTFQELGWRYIHWIQFAVYGAFGIVLVLVLRETRGSVLLSRKAAKLRQETGKAYYAKADAERASIAVLVRVSLTRPFHLLFFEPTVFFFSLWIAFAWGCMFLFLESVPLVFAGLHGFNAGETGLVFLATAVGAVIGVCTNVIQERLYHRAARRHGKAIPEARLYAACAGAILFAGGLFMYGWTSPVFWVVPALAVVIIFAGIYMIYLAVFNYLADAYTVYASSALAAQGFLRNVFGAAFPLFA